jgi:phosphoesterase RecJ-like protein
MSEKSMTIEEALIFLEAPREIAICGHVNPDGDALGSLLALAALLRAQGHQVTSLLANGTKGPKVYEFFENYEFVSAVDYTATPDLFIVVDSPNKERLGDGIPVFERAADTLVIDHHPDYNGFAAHYLGDSDSAATGLLIWNLILASGVTPTRAMAEYCYVALITDTGRFAFQNTNPAAFAGASQMIACGVNPADVSMRVYDSKSLAALKIEARLISRIEYVAGGRVVYSWVNEADFAELNVSRDETESLPGILRSVEGTDVAILLREEEGHVRVNLRAKASCDVGEFARRFGGGGHKAAAGFTLEMSLDEARAKILKETDRLVC